MITFVLTCVHISVFAAVNSPECLHNLMFLPCSVNLSLLVQLDVGTEVHVPVTASLVWPSLLHTNGSSLVVEFPTTTIGNSSVQHQTYRHTSYNLCSACGSGQ